MRVLFNEDVDQLNNQIHRYFIPIHTIKAKVYTSYQNIWLRVVEFHLLFMLRLPSSSFFWS